MSEFILSIDRGAFRVSKYGERPLNDELIVGRRNPDQEIEWRPGIFYYNPFYDGRFIYIYREDHKLISADNQTAAKNSLKKPYDRTWFEIIPQPLQLLAIPPGLRSMITAIPLQIKAVSQAVMQQLGIRVPTDFSPTDSESWYRWLETVHIPISSHFREALRRATSAKVAVSKETELEFVEGKVTAPSVEVQIRMFRIQEVTKRVRQIHDTNYVSVRLPKELLDQGEEAVKNWIAENQSIAGKFHLEQEPVSEHLLESKVTRSSPVGLIGYYRMPDRSWINLWAGSDTPNDLIREILGEREEPEPI